MINERQKAIIRILAEEQTVKISRLAKQLGVSDETIRRDMKFLEEQSMLKRVYGGAVFSNPRNREINYEERKSKNLAQKRAVAREVARLVHEGDSLAISGGTTNIEVARSLSTIDHLTIITNSVAISAIMAENQTVRVHLAGGEYNRCRYVTDGSMVMQFLSEFRADKAIISPAGISVEYGVTDYEENACRVMQRMMEISGMTIVCIDYSKLGTVTLRKICDVDAIQYIVVDDNAPTALLGRLSEKDITICLASTREAED